jgi:hypothetical protein
MEKPGGPPGRQSPAPRRLGKTRTRWTSWYRGTPTDKPGPEQHSPLDRPTPIQGKKRNWVISNKSNKDTPERGWGALSAEDWGKGILPRTVNKQAWWPGEALVGAGAHPATRSRKACEKILNCTQYRDSNNTKDNDGKTEKNRETSFPTAN